ncbi:hypothetical protein K501DRAFT_280327 [Backusella circina FSU 941]|nr:hypothetical protein K501DRAFT_280327 [Backusella circina FSU 941]
MDQQSSTLGRTCVEDISIPLFQNVVYTLDDTLNETIKQEIKEELDANGAIESPNGTLYFSNNNNNSSASHDKISIKCCAISLIDNLSPVCQLNDLSHGRCCYRLYSRDNLGSGHGGGRCRRHLCRPYFARRGLLLSRLMVISFVRAKLLCVVVVVGIKLLSLGVVPPPIPKVVVVEEFAGRNAKPKRKNIRKRRP